MIIYRIEDRSHQGPYNGSAGLSPSKYRAYAHRNEGRYVAPPKWPAPWDDIPGWPEPRPVVMMTGYSEVVDELEDFIFGFSSAEQLRSWFGRFAELLDQRNFRVASYEVDASDVMKGQHQVAFSRSRSKFLSHQSVNNFLSSKVDEQIAA